MEKPKMAATVMVVAIAVVIATLVGHHGEPDQPMLAGVPATLASPLPPFQGLSLPGGRYGQVTPAAAEDLAVTEAAAISIAAGEIHGTAPSEVLAYPLNYGGSQVWAILVGGGDICMPSPHFGGCTNTEVVLIDSSTGEVIGVIGAGAPMTPELAAQQSPASLTDILVPRGLARPSPGFPIPSATTSP